MTDTRTRMIEAAVVALQRDGVAGMSFTDVLAASGAARGAIYHHFPGGKAQLVAEAAARNAQDARSAFAALAADTPRAVVEAFLATVRPLVGASAHGGGCAVAAVTVGGEDLRDAAATAFASWTDVLAEHLRAAGLPGEEAADLASTLVIMLEGAHVLCRAAGSLEPFDRMARVAVQAC